MNFWATRLGQGTPQPQAPAPAPQQVQQGPWWANPLLTQQQAPQQPQQPFQQVPPPQQMMDEGTWGTVQGSMQKAKSARLTDLCPDCGSSNFMPQQNATMPICYECGYNPRFSQSTAGAGLPSGEGGAATPSRQIASGGRGGVSNYMTGAPIAHINSL